MLKMPHSKEAEQAVVGGLLINPEPFEKLRLRPDDFYTLGARTIFESMANLHQRRINIDYVTVLSELESRGALETIGGESELTVLISNTATAINAESYADILRDNRRRREIIKVANEIAAGAYNPDVNINNIVAAATTKLASSSSSTMQAIPLNDVLSDIYDMIEERSKNPEDIYGIKTCLPSLNAWTRGIQRKTTWVISGEPGTGKSWFAFQLGCSMADPKIGKTPGAVFELEMDRNTTVVRQLSAQSKIKAQRLMSGKLEDSEWPLLTHAYEEMSQYPIYISDDTKWDSLSLRVELARLKAHGVGWFIVDYMAKLNDPGKDATERSAFSANALHDIAKDLDMAGIVIHDMTKAGMSGSVGGQAQLAGDRRVLYEADMVTILRQTKESKGGYPLYRLEWEKFRNGERSDYILDLIKVGGFPMFGEIEKDYQPPAYAKGK